MKIFINFGLIRKVCELVISIKLFSQMKQTCASSLAIFRLNFQWVLLPSPLPGESKQLISRLPWDKIGLRKFSKSPQPTSILVGSLVGPCQHCSTWHWNSLLCVWPPSGSFTLKEFHTRLFTGNLYTETLYKGASWEKVSLHTVYNMFCVTFHGGRCSRV